MLIEVDNTKAIKEFFHLPYKVYKNDPEWIAPVEKEVKAVFDPDKNSFFKHGNCKRWILIDKKNETIGRIAAFINYHKNFSETPAGGIGFFECIDDREAAHQLFNKAREWIKSYDMKAMEGPVNFGENDKFWGLLVKGFNSPSYGMNYNPPYYAGLFESFGFEKAYDQFTNILDATKPLPERFSRIADWVMAKPDYSFRHFTFSGKEKYFSDFREIYNDAWKQFDNFSPIDIASIRDSFNKMKSIIDERIIWFAYYKNEPVAFILCLPDINQILKYLHGQLNLWNKIQFFFYKNINKITRLRIIVMGCKQQFQNHGIESALIRCLQKEVLPGNRIKEVELAWVGDFNQRMQALHKATGAVQAKIHRTYRFMFND